MKLLAFTPLLDPLPALFPGMSDYWLWLVIPLVLAIAVVYKGTRVRELRTLPREAGWLTVMILIYMSLAAAGLGAFYWAWVRFV